jgi:DNA (cytosine-5)-methyltransferase 1
MKHGSLFSGLGGFDLAAEWMGWENIFHCEWMEFPRKVLDYHFPNADSHIDICKTDFKKYANKIDILTGGFPCQPFSMAGKRKGTDDERYLWGEMLRAIQEIKPTFVIAENVFGITNIDDGLVFEQVCLDLEAEGYEVQPFIIPAAAKNAPHRRDRVWFVAIKNALFSRCLHGESQQEGAEVRKFGYISTRSSERIHLSKGDATNTQFERLEGYDRQRQGCTEYRSNEGVFFGAENQWDATDSNVSGCEGQRKQPISKGQIRTCGNSRQRNVTDSKCIRRIEIRDDNGEFEKTQQDKCRKKQFSRTDSTQSEWRQFPTQSPICSGDDGLPTELDGVTFPKWRAESIKGYGNAIVPQVALEIFKQLEKLYLEL